MNKIIIFSGLFLGSILLLQSPLQAEEVKKEKPAKIKRGFLEKFDVNKDGKVSKEEFKSYMGKRFQRMDVDKDDVITIDELGQYERGQQNKSKKSKLARLDSDGNGSISKEEFIAPRIKQIEKKFLKLDKNKDGKLTTDEFAKKKIQHSALFENIDANKDGKISNEEKDAALDRLFNRLDQDKDQIVTEKEVKEGRKHKMRKPEIK